MTPTISVVVATYQGEAVLEVQLRSILAQKLRPAEILVADDCSSDATVEVAERVGRSSEVPVEVQCNEHRLGYVENFLTAATRARGALVAFSDQDDVWLPEKLSHCARVLRSPQVAAVVHGSTLVDDQLQRVGSRIHTGVLRRLLHHDPLFVPHGSHMVFRSSLLRAVPPLGRPVSVYGHGAQEHDEWAFYAARAMGSVVVLARALMLYRRHKGAASFDQGISSRRRWLAVEGASGLSRRLDAAQGRAEHLRRCAGTAPPGIGDRLLVAASRYDRLAENLADAVGRSPAQRRGERLVGLARAVGSGRYRGSASGGLGVLALGRDAGAVVGASPPSADGMSPAASTGSGRGRNGARR